MEIKLGEKKIKGIIVYSHHLKCQGKKRFLLAKPHNHIISLLRWLCTQNVNYTHLLVWTIKHFKK